MSTAAETDSGSAAEMDAEEESHSSSLPLMDDTLISDLAQSVPAILKEEIKPREQSKKSKSAVVTPNRDPPPPPGAPSAFKDRADAEAEAEKEAIILSKKLKTILGSVAAEEGKLKNKLKSEQLRLKTIADTLCKASDVKGQLQAFDPYNDRHRKSEINLLLDELDSALGKLNSVENESHRTITAQLSKEFAEKLEVERKALQTRFKELGDDYESRVSQMLEELTALKLDNAGLQREKDTAVERYQTMKEAMKQSDSELSELRMKNEELNEAMESHDRLREEWMEQRKIKHEEITALMSRLEELGHQNDEYQHSISELHLERQRLSDELGVLHQEFEQCSLEKDHLTAENDKLSKEKIVLIKEVKNLRSQRTELVNAKEEIVASLKKLHKEQMIQLHADRDRTLAIKQRLVDRFKRREMTVRNLLNDLIAKIGSLDMTLQNATVAVLRDTTPDMTERERILKSSELIRQLSPLFSEATSHLDDVLLSHALKKGDERRRSASISGSLDSGEADSVLSAEESESVREYDLLIRQLAQTSFELICDKMTFTQMLNDASLKLLNVSGSSSSGGRR